jgi:hypothetical protein
VKDNPHLRSRHGHDYDRPRARQISRGIEGKEAELSLVKRFIEESTFIATTDRLLEVSEAINGDDSSLPSLLFDHAEELLYERRHLTNLFHFSMILNDTHLWGFVRNPAASWRDYPLLKGVTGLTLTPH